MADCYPELIEEVISCEDGEGRREVGMVVGR